MHTVVQLTTKIKLNVLLAYDAGLLNVHNSHICNISIYALQNIKKERKPLKKNRAKIKRKVGNKIGCMKNHCTSNN